MCPSSENFVSLRTSTRCGPNICPSTEDFILLWSSSTKYGSNNVLIVKRLVQSKQSLSINRHRTELPSPIALPYDQYTGKYSYQQASTKKWCISYPSRDKWQMTRIAHTHHCPMGRALYLDERGKHSYRIYMDLLEDVCMRTLFFWSML